LSLAARPFGGGGHELAFRPCVGSLWRDPVARTAKGSGKTFATALIKSGTPTESIWTNVVAFDEAPKAELLRLKAGESLSVQGPARLGVFEKNGEHRASLDITAAHVVALRQPPRTKPKHAAPRQAAFASSAPPLVPEFDDGLDGAF
jgi:hypothetical protein